ncbi:MAG: amidohydrolase family protein, partial [Elusimicrobiota bacterium]|nr:amidohydrolase family protein [Elusimicrobiota bacterium]
GGRATYGKLPSKARHILIPKMFDLIIRNAKLPRGVAVATNMKQQANKVSEDRKHPQSGPGREPEIVVDIGIKGTKIKQIAKKIREKALQEIDAEGNIVTETFIDPHIHLDKCLISDSIPKNLTGTLKESIELTWSRKRKYTTRDILQRAGEVVRWHILYGSTIIRTHVDVDTIGKLRPIEELLITREKYKNFVDLQIVAFPQEGILQDPGTEELLEKALQLAPDIIVGGMPHNEMTSHNSQKHIDICFKLAKKYNRDIDMHVDETDDPNSRTLEYLAYKTIEENYQGRVTAGHTCALAAYNDYYAAKVIELVKKAKINIITNPVTNLMIEGRLDKQPIRRGITRVKELIASGINVSYGQDCIKDAFYPTWGKADLLECGLITAHAAQFTRPEEVELLYDMITSNAAKILRVGNYGFAIGATANLNVINAKTIPEMFRTQSTRLYVIRHGKIIARTKTESELYLK